MDDMMDIGDVVKYRSGKYDGIKLTVAGVGGDRIVISRTDNEGEQWFRYEQRVNLVKEKV